jgi:digeranylgeranylglycerophospholipid reductase
MFPRGNGQVRLGVGVLRPDSEVDPMRLLQRLMADPRLADGLRGAQPLEYHAGALPAEPVEGPYSMAGLLLAGDSGAQASPLVGEGIRYAIRAGRLAGEIATRGDASAQALAEYDREWQRRFGQEMRLSWWLNRRLARYGDRNWRVVASLLARLSADQAADGLRGRFGAGWWLKLAAQSPVLLATAVSAALAGRSSEGQNPRV